ncbi:MAG: M56 family metallopeptidase [Verrucomicrobiota bacterium]|jgi:beta-lactamase regulating signal transducer with metallopeptidase domain/Tol biopolymer transport system component
MPAMLNGVEPVVTGLLRVSGQAAVLVLLVLLVQAACGSRLAARWRYALWLLVVARLLLPVSLPSSLSIFNLTRLRTVPEATSAAAPFAVQSSPARGAGPQPARRPSGAGLGPSASPALGQPVTTVPPALGEKARQAMLSWWNWFALVWLGGVVLLGARIVWQNVAFYLRLRREPTVTEAEPWRVLEDCRRLMGVRQRPALVETGLVHSPALYGLLRLRLLLPAKTLAALTGNESRYVFLHELAHVKRRDMVVNWFITVLQVAHWFNPLVWLAFRRMVADRELAADALALSRLEVRENVAYGNAIIKLLQNLLRPAPLRGLVGILEDKNQMKRRMRMIAEFRKTNRRPVLAVMVFVSLGLIGLTDAQANADRDSQTSRVAPASNDNIVIKTVLSGLGQEALGILSPDETKVAFVDWDRANTYPVVIKDLRTGESKDLSKGSASEEETDSCAGEIVWSPDASRVAYTWYVNGWRPELRLGALATGAAKVLKPYSPDAKYIPSDWSPDRKGLLCVVEKKDKGNDLAVVSLETGQVEVLASFPGTAPAHARFSPDGQRVVYEYTQGQNRDIYLIKLATKQVTRLTDSPAEEGSPVWSPDGKHILFSSNRRGEWDLVEINPDRPLSEPRLVKYGFGDYPKRVIQNAKIAFSTSFASLDVYSLEVNSATGEAAGEPVRLSGSFYGQHLSPAWSPDGRSIAYVRQGKKEWVLCIRSIADGREECIEAGMFPVNRLFWSPDSQALALSPRRKDGKMGVFYFPLSSRQSRPIVLCPDFRPKGFTPDGKEFIVWKADKKENVAVDIESGKERKLTLPEAVGPWNYDLSRDQSRIVYAEKDANSPEEKLVVADRNLQDKRVLARAKGISRPCWSPDGTKIAYLCNYKNDTYELWIAAADGRGQTKINLGSLKIFGNQPPDWSPDSRKLALTLGEGAVGEMGVIENLFAKLKGE